MGSSPRIKEAEGVILTGYSSPRSKQGLPTKVRNDLKSPSQAHCRALPMLHTHRGARLTGLLLAHFLEVLTNVRDVCVRAVLGERTI